MTSSATQTKDIVLTSNPLSRDYLVRLTALIGANFKVISIADLRRYRGFSMFSHLRSLRADRLFIPIEDANGKAYLPTLKLLSCLVRARKLVFLDSELTERPFTRMTAFEQALHLFQATLAANLAVRRVKREVAVLKQQELVATTPATRQGLYLNMGIWFGLKAGGSVGHISGVINAFAELGLPVHYMSAGGRLLVNEKTPFSELCPPAVFGVPWEFNPFRYHFSVCEKLKRSQADWGFIYQRMALINYTGVRLSREWGIPLILEYNGGEAWIAANWGKPLREQQLALEIEEVNLKHAHMVVTVSDVLRDELIARKVPPERILTYPNCIDPEMFNPTHYDESDRRLLCDSLKIPQDARLVTFIGTFGQWHGIEILAQAIRIAIDRELDWLKCAKLHFLLVGDGIMMPTVREILGKDANGAFVTLTGLVPQKDAPRYLAASDILASPHVPNADGSRFFGSPTKLFEYMAMAKPILASELDQIAEVLAGSLSCKRLPVEVNAENENAPALLCRPGDPEELLTSLRFLVEHPKWCARLGENARALALKKYTWEHHVEAILKKAEELKLLRRS